MIGGRIMLAASVGRSLVPIRPRLAKLIPRLASRHDAEVVATARAIERVLRSNGRDFHDLAAALAPAPANDGDDWRHLLRFCADHIAHLSERDADFVAALAAWRGRPSEKQIKWLRDIADRLRGEQ